MIFTVYLDRKVLELCIGKAELLREGIIFLIHLLARAILLMKKIKNQRK